jgi:exoribonuclease-2
VRADALPLVFRAVGSEQHGRGSAVRVRVGAIDLLTLDVAASVVAELGAHGEASAGADDEDGAAAGPHPHAIDVEAPEASVDADPVAAEPA